MKKIIQTILFCLAITATKAQMPNLFPNNTQKANGILPLKFLGAPTDTIFSKWGLAVKLGTLYVGDGVKWSSVSSGSTTTITAASFKSTEIKIFENNDSAIAGNLKNGDEYYLPYNNGAYVKANVVEKIIIPLPPVDSSNNSFFISVNHTTTDRFNRFQISSITPITLSIDWGDGVTQDYTDSSLYNPQHIYTSNESYRIKITPSDLSLISLVSVETNNGSGENAGLTGMYNIDKLSNLGNLLISQGVLNSINDLGALPDNLVVLRINNNLITDVNSYIFPSRLQTLYLNGNQLTNFNPNVALPSLLTSLDLSENPITVFNPSIALPINLSQLFISNSQITTFNPSIALPDNLQNLILNNNNQLTTFNPSIALPNGLQSIQLIGTGLTAFNPSIALPNGLQNLYIINSQLTTFNPTLPLPSSLRDLYLIGNLISTFDPTIPLPSNLQSLYVNGDELTSFNPTTPLPSNLTTLYLGGRKLTAFDPSIALPSNLQSLYLLNSSVTVFDPSIALPNNMYTLYLVGNLFTSFNPTIALPNRLQNLYLIANQMTDFTQTIPLPSSINQIYISNNKLSTNSINNFLISEDAKNLTNKSYNVGNQSPFAPPSGAGITAKQSLISRGNQVNTD